MEHPSAASSPSLEVLTPHNRSRLVLSATLTLTLSILGSSVLPVPFAISRTGIFMGLVTMVVVAYSNALTSILLLRASGRTGHDTYEGVAESAGGPVLKVATRVSLILLLFVLPLCCMRRMRSLELAGTAGVGVVAAIACIMVWDSWQAGFPAIASGDLPLWAPKASSDLPEAFSVLGFAFYIQPMMMPLLHEMPSGQLGIALTERAVYIVVMGVAISVYGIMGFAAAARYGQATQGNVLVNTWLGGPAEGLLDAVMAIYLSISIPPMQMSLRYTLDCLVAGEAAPPSTRRQILETVLIVLGSLSVALVFPSAAEKIFAVTGATAVCLVCYLLPVVIHLLLRTDRGEQTGPESNQGATLEAALRSDVIH
ncbi:hypothetical protein WJX73_009477 [Symbiochloris irregularis]|uniref:Amino acid transporter transmembrane domain-containing protein n=1 Tax=Symbiochloris irregularis TaxID=706552 RepID=A0AAW1PJM9_9CHLO